MLIKVLHFVWLFCLLFFIFTKGFNIFVRYSLLHIFSVDSLFYSLCCWFICNHSQHIFFPNTMLYNIANIEYIFYTPKYYNLCWVFCSVSVELLERTVGTSGRQKRCFNNKWKFEQITWKIKETNVKIVYSKCLYIEQQRQHLYHSKTKINITGLNVCFVISLDNRKRISSLNGYVWLENSDCTIRKSLIELFLCYFIICVI